MIPLNLDDYYARFSITSDLSSLTFLDAPTSCGKKRIPYFYTRMYLPTCSDKQRDAVVRKHATFFFLPVCDREEARGASGMIDPTVTRQPVLGRKIAFGGCWLRRLYPSTTRTRMPGWMYIALQEVTLYLRWMTSNTHGRRGASVYARACVFSSCPVCGCIVPRTDTIRARVFVCMRARVHARVLVHGPHT